MEQATLATFNLKRFAEPDRLRSIEPQRLIAFLTPFRDYLTRRQFPWPEAAEAEIDYEHLVWALMNPDDDVPRTMVDALYIVHEMATPDGMDDLLERMRHAEIPLDDDPEIRVLS